MCGLLPGVELKVSIDLRPGGRGRQCRATCARRVPGAVPTVLSASAACPTLHPRHCLVGASSTIRSWIEATSACAACYRESSSRPVLSSGQGSAAASAERSALAAHPVPRSDKRKYSLPHPPPLPPPRGRVEHDTELDSGYVSSGSSCHACEWSGLIFSQS